MTLHAKNGKPGCISYRFMNFLFSEGGLSPLVMPLKGGVVIFFLRIGRGVWHDYSCKNGKPDCSSYRFMNFFILRGGPPPIVTPLKVEGACFFLYRKKGMA